MPLCAPRARRRDLFAVFDDLHDRLERGRRTLPGLPVRWVEGMKGPRGGAARAVLCRRRSAWSSGPGGDGANNQPWEEPL